MNVMRPHLLCLAFAACLAAADVPVSAPRPDLEPSIEEIQTLRRILELPPERLSRIRGAIEKMERMPPEARRDFAERLAKFENASPEERHALSRDMRERGGFGGRLLEHHLRSLPPEEARRERERIMAMTPEARMDFVRSLAERYPEIAAKEKRPEPKDGKSMKRRPGVPPGPLQPPQPK